MLVEAAIFGHQGAGVALLAGIALAAFNKDFGAKTGATSKVTSVNLTNHAATHRWMQQV